MYRKDKTIGYDFLLKLRGMEDFAKNAKVGVWSLERPVYPKEAKK